MKKNSDEIIDFCQQYGIEIQLSSGRYRFHTCPFCQDNKWKVWLYENDQAGSCFKCKSRFSLRYLLFKFGIPLTDLNKFFNTSIVDPEVIEKGLVLNEEKLIVTTSNTAASIELQSWRFWQIEEMLDHPAAKYALSRGLPKELYSEVRIDVLSNAVVFLIRDLSGSIIGFQERYVDPKSDSKTWNTPGIKTSNHLLVYGQFPEIFICEGPFNAITAFNWGFTGVCTFGSKLSVEQMSMIRDLAKDKGYVYCAFDNDSAGEYAYLQLKEISAIYGLDVLRVLPEYGNDINDSFMANKRFTVLEKEDVGLLNYLPELL